MSSDPSAFALARLDEEEADARAAQHDDAVAPGTWTTGPSWPESSLDLFVFEDRSGHFWTVGELYAPIARHVARQDPAATLARVAALRALIDLHRPRWAAWMQRDSLEALDDLNSVERASLRPESSTSVERVPYLACLICEEPAPCPSLRHVVAIWAWHEDYDERWKL